MMDIRNILLYTALACLIKESIQICDIKYGRVLQCQDIKTPTELAEFSYYGQRHIYVTNSSFTTLKANAFEGVYIFTIKITRTSLRTIEPSVFDNLPALNSLDLSQNNISTITRGIFNDRTKLTTLDLSKNSIQFIEDNSFSGNISDLNLNGNKLDILPSLKNSTKLERLHISDNDIMKLQNNHLPSSLQHLYLRNNRIESIEMDAFAGLATLFELDLSNNKLYKAQKDGCLPLGILQPLVALSHLNISRNGLSCILPGTFPHLDSSDIRTLTIDLSHNNISTITRGIFNNFTKFMTLDLSNNSIQFIEYNSFLGSKIIDLNLHRNKIDTFRPIRNCTTLERLQISDNHIIKLQNNDLPRSLKNLHLGNNRIESIEMEAFARMTELVELDLSNNKLYKVSDGCIPLGMLQPLVKLVYLNVSHNGLSRILLGTFSHMDTLSTLDLGYNNLTQLPSGLLRQLPLTFLSISNNMIKELEDNYINPRHGVTVNLDGNQWTCNYLSHKIHQILTINTYNTVITGNHVSSPNINGIKCNPNEPKIPMDNSVHMLSLGFLNIIADHNADLVAGQEETNNLLVDIKGLLNNITLLKVKDLQQLQKIINETGDQFSNITKNAPLGFKDMLNNVTIAIAENSEQLRIISNSDEEQFQYLKTVTSAVQKFQGNDTGNEALPEDQKNSELSSIRVLLLSFLLSNIALIGLILATFALKHYTSKRNAHVEFTQDTLLDTYS